MSIWPEIKKAVNSDFNKPLNTLINHLAWYENYAIFGEDSYVFQNKIILHELYEDYELCMNSKSIQTETFDYVVTNNTEVGKALASVGGIDAVDTLVGLTTVEQVIQNTEAMTAVASSEIAMMAMVDNETTNDAMFNSDTARNAIVNSEAAMSVVAYDERMLNNFANSETTLNQICSSEVAMKAVSGSDVAMNIFLNNEAATNTMVVSDVAMTEISKSIFAMEQVSTAPKMVVAIAKNTAKWATSLKKTFFTNLCATKAILVNMYDILMDSNYFTRKTNTYGTNPSYFDQYATAEFAANGLIACALGTNGNTSSSTSMLIDGELIIESNEYNQPTSVSSDQVNAIGCPTATFTQNVYGYMAIEVFIAK